MTTRQSMLGQGGQDMMVELIASSWMAGVAVVVAVRVRVVVVVVVNGMGNKVQRRLGLLYESYVPSQWVRQVSD